MGKTRDVTDASFETEVLKSVKPVIVDFWASWCAPCIRLSPVLEQLAEDCADKVDVVKVNVDENPETASEFGITSIPAVYLFKDGQQKISVVGARPKPFFEKEFAEYLQ
ncbi:thioredoxin [Arthrobacter sp. U41]|uniref:thioredoxin n=1 Tax=Arthrobacter sp. U41 TaxID=1849032 RepID=UPI0008595A98|nr:thioredoxin [Arthrobacter sp. U41]AOT03263.1 thioredoxin [Arthrobacter sp. U41]